MEFSDYRCYKSENVKKNKSGLAVRKMKTKIGIPSWGPSVTTQGKALATSAPSPQKD